MNDDRLEDLAEIVELPPDHPRRKEFERSPRGRALLAAYVSFARPGAAPEEARVADAKAKLDALLMRELGLDTRSGDAPRIAPTSEATPDAGPARGISGRPVRGPSRRRSWLGALRPAFALAALAVVGAGVWFASHRPGEAVRELRGRRVDGNGAPEVTVALHAARSLPGGAVELSWQPVPGADRYEVSFFAQDLSDLAHAAPAREPRLVLAPDALPAGLRRGADVLWQVTARRGLAPLAVSETAPLRIP